MKKLIVLMFYSVFVLYIDTSNATEFYAMQDVSIDRLVKYNSSGTDDSVEVVNYLGNISSLGDVPSGRLEYSKDNRLFLLPYGTTIYEIDTSTGMKIDSFDLGYALEGITTADNGLLYVNYDGHAIIEVDFDNKSTRTTVNYSNLIDIDDIDFDGYGNLIGSDLNQSGNLYNIPLDGSTIQTIGNYSGISAGGISYSSIDNSFYFFSQSDNGLWELPWLNGNPNGDVEFIKSIDGGRLLGITVVPEPATMLLLLGALPLMRRRKR